MLEKIKSKGTIMLDGGFGTELIRRGITSHVKAETIVYTHPELVEQIHRDYVKSGSDMIYANTFSANRYKLEGSGYTVEQAVEQAVRIARKACDGSNVAVGLDVAPLGKLLEPSGTLTFEEAYDAFVQIIKAGVSAGVDYIGMETFTDLLELKAAVLAAKEHSNLPVFATMSFEPSGRTFNGTDAKCAAVTISGLGVDAFGINCSAGPDRLASVVEDILAFSTVPVIVKPNAGMPDADGHFSMTPEQFAEYMLPLVESGAVIIGGCCGTTPGHIAALKKVVSGVKPVERTPARGVLCSGNRLVRVDEPRVIGERINPTGKKLFRQALAEADDAYVLRQAVEQAEAGAEILDVNVGTPGIDEKATMIRLVKAIQSVVELPLQLDSTSAEVLEAGLRVYCGKPIINSVNGSEKSLDEVLPLAKKYGAAVIGLTLDDSGIPATAQERVAIARRILDRALALGIPREDVFIDCLTMTVSTDPQAPGVTLEAVRTVKEQLALKTALGVSNISFGLPSRENINSTFLTLALESGLDLPIINPNSAAMMNAVRSFRVLRGFDADAQEYISACSCEKPAEQKQQTTLTLEKAVRLGLVKEACAMTQALLSDTEPEEIINSKLIPVLDAVGNDFETGRLYLPQLMKAADTAGACFDCVKKHIAETSEKTESKGKIILATARGDIHDIGKNIVRTMLESYGFDVIDLGRDVPEEKIVQAAIDNDVKLVGLSALMTTTLDAMQSTIAALRASGHECTVMVGGAVLTEQYAMNIGADYYAANAKESVDIAKKVI